MGRVALNELFHLAFGVVLTLGLFRAAAWAYPIGGATTLAVGWGTTAVVLAMAVGPLWRALKADRGERA